MAALSGGEMCIKYLMFAFNLVFWVSVKRYTRCVLRKNIHLFRVSCECVRKLVTREKENVSHMQNRAERTYYPVTYSNIAYFDVTLE